ncbi:hypothetical protein AQ490_18610 [Wenjunlia vitaminophila]|uniref:Oxidoreductase n=1 Tax=Wenjunlia vitaminophila TaxID=76728 RepID=A0A0T6LUJ2_WENVI|nr:Gfo/Idh/MocA family oxidoreductase [Wenjunlia vitaminophila]KRV49720.1 hypothetical protein AQ490_18610 [Wenjunlia vitaminophila]
MLRTLIVGFGRAGAGLHWQVLRGLRAEPGNRPAPWSPEPPVVLDVRDVGADARSLGLVPARSLNHAARLTDPARTVVHLCTPPADRPGLLRSLADLGFRRILMEKPLAGDEAGAEAIAELARERRLLLRVVSPWLFSSLTHALGELVRDQSLGRPRSISFTQSKPRWTRTLRSDDHPTAFDVELPHSIGVALRLAGDARIEDAECEDMRLGDRVIPAMGRARLVLRHTGGVTTDITSDLTSPVRERRVSVRFDRGLAVGHYPVSEADHHASLTVAASADGDRPPARRILQDDAFAACLRNVYHDYATGVTSGDDYPIGQRVVSLLHRAKSLAAGHAPASRTDGAA